MLCVLHSINGSEYQGVPHHAIRVFLWWTMFSHFGILQQTHHKYMMKLLFKLRDNYCPGPIIQDKDMPADVSMGVKNTSHYYSVVGGRWSKDAKIMDPRNDET
jgi:hypothetical protein